jgi:hypothetical protein
MFLGLIRPLSFRAERIGDRSRFIRDQQVYSVPSYVEWGGFPVTHIFEHVCGPYKETGECYYCGRPTEHRCYTCADQKYVCPDEECTLRHERREVLDNSKNLSAFCVTLVVILFLVSVSAKAQSPSNDISASGNQFLEVCSSVDLPVDKATAIDLRNMGLCQGYMQGFSDGAGVSILLLQHDNPSLASLKGSLEDFGICFPEGVNLLQVIRIVLKYIREHPEQARTCPRRR